MSTSPFATAAFWAGLAERSISTFAGALLAVLGGDAAGLLSVDWPAALSVAALATVVSVLKAVAAPGFTAGQPDDSGGYSVDHLDEITTVTRYRPPVDTTPVPDDYQPRYRAGHPDDTR